MIVLVGVCCHSRNYLTVVVFLLLLEGEELLDSMIGFANEEGERVVSFQMEVALVFVVCSFVFVILLL